MKKTLLFLSKHKNTVVRGELARAHIMIGLLALVVVTLLALGNVDNLVFDPVLSSIAAALLVIVAIISFGVACALLRRK